MNPQQPLNASPNPKPTPQPGAVMDVQRSRTSAQGSVVSPMAPADTIPNNPTPTQGQIPQTPKKPVDPIAQKRKKRMIIMIVSVASALIILAGVVTGFIIMQNNKKPLPELSETQSENQRVNVAEIDATTETIDKTLNTLNDSQDFSPNDINDQALGL